MTCTNPPKNRLPVEGHWYYTWEIELSYAETMALDETPLVLSGLPLVGTVTHFEIEHSLGSTQPALSIVGAAVEIEAFKADDTIIISDDVRYIAPNGTAEISLSQIETSPGNITNIRLVVREGH